MKINRENFIDDQMQDTRNEVLDKLIKENDALFDHHLQEMTKYEQRVNVLKSFKAQKTQKPSLN